MDNIRKFVKLITEVNQVVLQGFKKRIDALARRAAARDDVEKELLELEEDIWDAHYKRYLETSEEEAEDIIKQAYAACGCEYNDDPWNPPVSQEEIESLMKIFGDDEPKKSKKLRIVK